MLLRAGSARYYEFGTAVVGILLHIRVTAGLVGKQDPFRVGDFDGDRLAIRFVRFDLVSFLVEVFWLFKLPGGLNQLLVFFLYN